MCTNLFLIRAITDTSNFRLWEGKKLSSQELNCGTKWENPPIFLTELHFILTLINFLTLKFSTILLCTCIPVYAPQLIHLRFGQKQTIHVVIEVGIK